MKVLLNINVKNIKNPVQSKQKQNKKLKRTE